MDNNEKKCDWTEVICVAIVMLGLCIVGVVVYTLNYSNEAEHQKHFALEDRIEKIQVLDCKLNEVMATRIAATSTPDFNTQCAAAQEKFNKEQRRFEDAKVQMVKVHKDWCDAHTAKDLTLSEYQECQSL